MRVLRCSAARAHSDHLAPRCLGRVSGRTSSGQARWGEAVPARPARL